VVGWLGHWNFFDIRYEREEWGLWMEGVIVLGGGGRRHVNRGVVIFWNKRNKKERKNSV